MAERVRYCLVCGIGDGDRWPVRHFNLTVSIKGERPTSRGAGSVDLCDRCRARGTEKSRIRGTWAP